MIFYLYVHFFFFFNDTATTEIYTLSLHDALPIGPRRRIARACPAGPGPSCRRAQDRKSTRLNSSHVSISYAVFRLKKKNKPPIRTSPAPRREPHGAADAGPTHR